MRGIINLAAHPLAGKYRPPTARFNRAQPIKSGDDYRRIWRIVDGAVRDALASHPEYLTPVGHSSARRSIVKRVSGALAPRVGAVDMIFTDPPYGHNNNNGDLIHRWEAALGRPPGDGDSSLARPIANDGAEAAHELAEWLFAVAPKILRAGGCCCCCCGGPDPQFARWALLMDGPLDFKQMIVWDKGPIGMGWHYRRSYETVLVGQKRGAACKWYDETDRIENIIRPGHLGIRKIIPRATDHPTPKPPELAQHFIRLHSLPGDVVFDPFMGGCSTGVAAVAEGRGFVGIDIEPRWFDLACKRISAALAEPRLPFDEKPKAATQPDLIASVTA